MGERTSIDARYRSRMESPVSASGGVERSQVSEAKEATGIENDVVGSLSGLRASEASISVALRPTFHSLYLHLAETMALRSTCIRKKVGTVITSTDGRQVFSVGYNGNASKLPNCCDRTDPGNCGCLHSEANAAVNCHASRELEKYVYVTLLPCVQCCKLIIQIGGVTKVFFRDWYRCRDSLTLFATVGIQVTQLPSPRFVF